MKNQFPFKPYRHAALSGMLSILAGLQLLPCAVQAQTLTESSKTTKIADPNTAEDYQTFLEDSAFPGAIDSRYAGKIWTDKSVWADDAVTLDQKTITNDSDFLVSASFLGSTRTTVGANAAPIDLMVIFDHSGSMSSGNRMSNGAKAVNTLLNAVTAHNSQTRIGLTSYDNSSTLNLPLDHYTWTGDPLSVSGDTISFNTQNDAGQTVGSSFSPSGGTDLSAGLQTGMSELVKVEDTTAENIQGHKVDRHPVVLILTDGDISGAASTGTSLKQQIADKYGMPPTIYMIGTDASGLDGSSETSYVDQIYSADFGQLDGVFDEIIQSMRDEAFDAIEDSVDGQSTPMRYADPIGEYMEVKEVQGVLWNGSYYTAVEDPNTPDSFTFQLAEGETEPDASLTEGKADLSGLKVSIQKEETEDGLVEETLRAEIPNAALPLTVDDIVIKNQAIDSYTSTQHETRPLRILYTVGLQDSVQTDGVLDSTKIDPEYRFVHTTDTGELQFYATRAELPSALPEPVPDTGSDSNPDGNPDTDSEANSEKTSTQAAQEAAPKTTADNHTKPEADETSPAETLALQGTTTVRFTPGAENTFYQDYQVYADADCTETVSPDQVTNHTLPEGTYYFKTEYFVSPETAYGYSGETTGYVETKFERTAAELSGSVEVIDDRVVAHFQGVQGQTVEKADNPTQTATLVQASAFEDAQVVNTLGNNGVLTLDQPELMLSKTVSGDGLDESDKTRSFDFTLTLKDAQNKPLENEFVIFDRSENREADQSEKGLLAFNASGKAQLRLGHDQKVEISGLPVGASVHVEEADYAKDGFTAQINQETTREFSQTIADASDLNVDVVNVKQKTKTPQQPPKTGISSSPFSRYMLGAISIAGLVLALVSEQRKKHMH